MNVFIPSPGTATGRGKPAGADTGTSAGTGVLLVSGRPASLGGRSGYHRLAEYLPGADAVTAARGTAPRTLLPRLGTRLLRGWAGSRWYLASSATLEAKARLAWRRDRQRIVHLLWADHDWGYLDLTLPGDVALVGTVHLDADLLPGVFRQPERLLRFAALILMSECQREPLLDLGVPAERLHVIPHGIDTEFFSPGPSRTAADSLTVLHVGTHRRDFDMLLEVAERFRDRRDVRFELIAAPDVHSRFAHLPNVRCLSGLTDEQLRGRYRSAGCLLQMVTAATANNALLEGMACGLPVVSQRVGGIPEYADERAILCEPGEADAASRAVLAVAGSPALRSVMGHSARRRAEALSWGHVAAATAELYEALV